MKEFKVFEDMKSEIPEGATHYFNETYDDFFAWLKFNGDTAYMMMPHSNCFSRWTLCEYEAIFKNANKIPEKPTRTEYEKVDFKPDEIWKAFKEHQEDGFLFVQTSDEFECLGDSVFTLAMAISQGDQLYRRVEKDIDWRDEVHAWQRTQKGIVKPALNFVTSEFIESNPDKFLELCRVALRANGEIE